MIPLSRETAAQRLQVPTAAGPKELHSAYRKAARAHHPDVGGSAEEFQEISEAYTYLLSAGWVDEREEARPELGRTKAPVVWVRSKCSVLSIIVGLVEAVALLLLPIFLGVTFYGVTVVFAGLALVIRLMYLAVGRPLERKKNGAAVTSDPGWDTGPIPRVSVEEVEKFERPGY